LRGGEADEAIQNPRRGGLLRCARNDVCGSPYQQIANPGTSRPAEDGERARAMMADANT
jgi:hypothetical protein